MQNKHTITTSNQPFLHRRTELNTKLDLPTMALPLIDLRFGLPNKRAGGCLRFVGHGVGVDINSVPCCRCCCCCIRVR